MVILRRSFATFMILILVALTAFSIVQAATEQVLPDDIGGAGDFWRIDYWDVDGPGAGSDPSASLEANGALPTLSGFGLSSLQMNSGPGTGGAGCARLGGKPFFGTQNLAGMRLGDLTELSYSFLVESTLDANLAPYVNIFVDNDGDGVWAGAVDSILIFEAYYSNSASDSPTAHAISTAFSPNQWYRFDAIGGDGNGRWHYAAQEPVGADVGQFTPGAGGATDIFWSDIVANAATADLQIVNPPGSGCGVHGPEGTTSGLVFATGQKDGGGWSNHTARLDEVSLNGTTYDLNLSPWTLVFATQPTDTDAGETIPAIMVEVRDENDNVVSEANIDITIAIDNNPAGGILSGTTTVTATNGVATFTDLSINAPGEDYTLVASADDLTPVTSEPFDILGETVQPTPTPGPDDEDDDDDDGEAAAGAPSRTFDCTDLGRETNGAMTASGTVGNVAAYGLTGNTFCRIIALSGTYITNPAEVGNAAVINQGVVQAVDLFGLLPGGTSVVPFTSPVGVCLLGSGNVYFLSAADATRSVSLLPASVNGAYTCVSIPTSGTVVLAGTLSSDVPVSAPSAPVEASASLSDCSVTTINAVRLRMEPNTISAIITTLPYNVTFTATEKASGWYRVIYQDGQGWVSADYLTTSGDC